jgi:tRNA threonylcarbamoyl adenosine modification protein YeaZ
VILAFSSSSALASVAAISFDGEIRWEGSRMAPRSASSAIFSLLSEMAAFGLGPSDAELFAADIGPGSFTGVRVGVMVAKAFGYVFSKPVAGATAFDLISPGGMAAIPSKRGEWFVREPGKELVRTATLQLGIEIVEPVASGFARLVDELQPMSAAEFVPEYLIEPSISQPKKPFRGADG